VAGDGSKARGKQREDNTLAAKGGIRMKKPTRDV